MSLLKVQKQFGDVAAIQAIKLLRWRATAAVERALESGELKIPESCEACGKPITRRTCEAHHPDGYGKPLVVRWLCRSCHRRLHWFLRRQVAIVLGDGRPEANRPGGRQYQAAVSGRMQANSGKVTSCLEQERLAEGQRLELDPVPAGAGQVKADG